MLSTTLKNTKYYRYKIIISNSLKFLMLTVNFDIIKNNGSYRQTKVMDLTFSIPVLVYRYHL